MKIETVKCFTTYYHRNLMVTGKKKTKLKLKASVISTYFIELPNNLDTHHECTHHETPGGSLKREEEEARQVYFVHRDGGILSLTQSFVFNDDLIV